MRRTAYRAVARAKGREREFALSRDNALFSHGETYEGATRGLIRSYRLSRELRLLRKNSAILANRSSGRPKRFFNGDEEKRKGKKTAYRLARACE